MCCTHFVQGFRRQLRRLEQLRHFAGRQLPRRVSLAQAVETRVIPLFVLIQGDETPRGRRTGFLLHSRRVCVAADAYVCMCACVCGGGEKPLRANRSIHGAPNAPAPVSSRKRRFWQAEGGGTSDHRVRCQDRLTASAQSHPLRPPIRAGCSSTDPRLLGAVERRKHEALCVK